jgi:NAD(P)-dependent dehydrogenase (short-subunit alcohol dehydrogenase family)
MIDPLRGKTVLITGGTKGIGLATGLAFAGQGAHCILTHRWGSADEAEIQAKFAELSAPAPLIVEADVSHDDDTIRLLEEIQLHHDHLDVFVSNVAMAQAVQQFGDYEKRVLFKSMEYSAWPLFAYLRRIHERFGRYPRYAIGISSSGPDHYSRNYDFVAACKAVMETLARYAAGRLDGTNLNIVRPGFAPTESLRTTFGGEFEAFAQRYGLDRHFTPPEEVAKVIVALCSGLLDGVNGQVLAVDRGVTFSDTLARIENECGPINQNPFP